jgi:YidC/Oxa1 family membrane protein insertase
VTIGFLKPLYQAVAVLIVGIHSGLAPIFGANSGASWALSIVLLTIAMRLVLFPIFVKQIRNQRAMQTLQPKMKELQAKYKNDKEKLNQEMMALWKEHGANPLSGCLPLLLQIPIFISLFHTLRSIKPISGCKAGPNSLSCYKSVPGFSQANIFSAAHAKIFSVPISADFTSSTAFLHDLGGSQTATRVLCLLLTVLMGATTFITQRQLMARSGPAASSQMAQQQKILLYVFPLVFLLYGFKFPIGVLLYWLTTNVWSMVQQRFVIRRMEPVAAGAPDPDTLPAGPAPGAKPAPRAPGPAKTPPKAAEPKPPPKAAQSKTPPKAAQPPKTPPKPATAGGDLTLPPGGAIPTPPRASNPRRPAGRSKNRKRGRR